MKHNFFYTVILLNQGLVNYNLSTCGPSLACCLFCTANKKNSLYWWTFAIDLIIRNTNFESQVKWTVIPKTENPIFLISRPVLQKLELNYYFLNFIIEKCMKICLPSCCVSAHLIFSIFPLDSWGLKYVFSVPSLKQFVHCYVKLLYFTYLQYANKIVVSNTLLF